MHNPPALTLTPLPGIPLIRHKDDLASLILRSLRLADLSLQDGDILVLAQKIVSKAEGRMVNLKTVRPTPAANDLARQAEKDPRLVQLILNESNAVLRVRPGTIVVEHRLGFVCASAGIDHSNVRGDEKHSDGPEDEDWVLLLPESPDASAAALRQKIEAATHAHVGVMIIDSHGRAWRLGIVGTTIGLSGVPGIVDQRGNPDLFRRPLRITQTAAADELAAAASLIMGQAAEGRPVVHVRGFPYALRESSSPELFRPKEQDMFR